MTINELVADGKDFDGVYFCKSNENGTEGWSLTFLNLERKQDRKFEEHEIGIKYQIMLHDESDKVEIFEAVLGDPRSYLKNMIDCNQQGMLMKKCKRSQKIFSKILGKKEFRNFQRLFDAP
jgi:hypothetical protein